MEFLHVAIIVASLGFLDATSCYFLTKTFNFDWNKKNGWKANMSTAVFYKTKLSSVYCSYDEICCGQSCCPDPSATPSYYYSETYNYQYYSGEEDSQVSTGSYLGMAFAIVVGFSICMSCCIACCKQKENERTNNMTLSNVQPVVAYSSDNGAIIIRQEPRDNPSSSSSASSSSGEGGNSNHDTSQMLGASESHGFSLQDTQGNRAPPYECANLSQISEPPPSYEYVMSHNYPTYSDSRYDSTKAINEQGS